MYWLSFKISFCNTRYCDSVFFFVESIREAMYEMVQYPLWAHYRVHTRIYSKRKHGRKKKKKLY